MHRRQRAAGFILLASCDILSGAVDDGREESVRAFPKADRPVAQIISTRWSNEESRDRLREADKIMDAADVRPGMTVADIGAGEGYYTVRLAKRVGAEGRVLAEDIVPEVIDALGRRINRENWSNVSVKLGTPSDPKLPARSFDRVFLVHMYHEITEPYAFIWHLRAALKPGGQIVVVDANRLTQNHGTPPPQLKCEFEAVGYRQIEFRESPFAGGYLARFVAAGPRPEPEAIRPCVIHVAQTR